MHVTLRSFILSFNDIVKPKQMLERTKKKRYYFIIFYSLHNMDYEEGNNCYRTNPHEECVSTCICTNNLLF